MKSILGIFVESAQEFKNLRSVIQAALLIALHTVLAVFVSIQVTTSVRISVSFLANVVTGCLFGPVMGFVCGGVGDIVQYILKPTGPYFPGWTLNASIAGMLYGLFLYKKFPLKVMDNTKTEKINANKLNDRWNKIIHIFLIAIPIVIIAVLLLCPILSVTENGNGQIVRRSALGFILTGTGSGTTNPVIISWILVVAVIVMEIAVIAKFNKTALTISVIACFTTLLAVYTDKKVMSADTGYNIAVGMFLLFMIIIIAELEKDSKFDFKYIIRLTVLLFVDSLLVNILLGTYWVTVMYGKGFMFYFAARLIKNLIQLPINIALSYYILSFVRDIGKKIQ